MSIIKNKHFAEALFEIGREKDNWPEFYGSLESVREKIKSVPELQTYLTARQIDFEKKRQALREAFKQDLGAEAYNFLFLLIKSNKLSDLGRILQTAEQINLQKNNLQEVVVESTELITPEQSLKIKEAIVGKIDKKVVLKNIINEKLIGGIKININDTVIDGSLIGKIKRLRTAIDTLNQ